MDINSKRTNQMIPICKWYDSIHMKPKVSTNSLLEFNRELAKWKNKNVTHKSE